MELFHRKSPRIIGYDYSTPNYYFITICTYEKKCMFGDPGQLNEFGRMAEENLLKITKLYPRISLDKYVIMPNHIHCIFVVSADIHESSMRDLRTVIGQYKMSVTKRIRMIEPDMNIWQRSFHDHIIRNQKSYEKIWMYIDNNPIKWKEDCFYFQDTDA